VRGEEVMCVTGRSVFLDGGLRMIRLNARTGTLLAEHAMGDEDPERPGTGFQYRLKGLSMPVGLPDILSCDGERVYMRSQKFDLEGRRVGLGPVPSTAGGGRHIFSPTGFLDASWMHRSYWVYGTGFDEGAGGWPKAGKVVPAGRILCHDSKSVYGYGRTSKYYQWSTPLEYHLFAAAKNPATGKKGRSASRVSYRWSRETKLHVTSIVVAGDILLVAGPPSLMDEVNAFRDPFSERSRAKMKDQADAFCGERGLLKAVATSTGGDIAEMTLDYLPAFDGMAVAEGKLFLTSDDGVLVCYEAR
jgi:hypothetical protein